MITTRIAGLLAGIALAIGLVVGAAGAIARDAVDPGSAADRWADHMAGMAGMMGSGASGMGPGMMGGASGMGPNKMGADASSMLDWMRQHHGATPQVTP